LTYFRNRIRLIKILFLEIFIHLWMNSKFDCIVCRRTLFALPVFYIYGITGSYFQDMKSYPISRWFAGNFGGSSMFCKQTRLSVGRMEIKCPAGSIAYTDKAIFGVISKEFSSYVYC
jgi:hypothetical protein